MGSVDLGHLESAVIEFGLIVGGEFSVFDLAFVGVETAHVAGEFGFAAECIEVVFGEDGEVDIVGGGEEEHEGGSKLKAIDVAFLVCGDGTEFAIVSIVLTDPGPLPSADNVIVLSRLRFFQEVW